MGKRKPAFFYFMVDIKPELIKKGHSFPNGFADVTKIAQPLWEALPKREKDIYCQRSKTEHNINKSGQVMPQKTSREISNKLDNLGNNIQQRDILYHAENEKTSVEDRLIMDSLPKDNVYLMNYPFYLLDFQYRLEYQTENFQPVEIAIIKFTLSGGILDEYHEFINPGRSESGIRGPALVHSDETHKIPWDFELGTIDYQSVWVKFAQFLGITSKYSKCPFIFVLNQRKNMATIAVEWLFNATEMPGYSPVSTLYSLENLFVILKFREEPKLFHPGFKIHSDTNARELLLTTDFDYLPNIHCKWHDNIEIRHCCLGHIRRYAYVMAHELQKIYNFEMTSKHQPKIDPNSYTIIQEVQCNLKLNNHYLAKKDKKYNEAMKFSNSVNQKEQFTNNYSDIRYAENSDIVMTSSFTKKAAENRESATIPCDKTSSVGFKSPWSDCKADITANDNGYDEAFPVNMNSPLTTSKLPWGVSGSHTNVGTDFPSLSMKPGQSQDKPQFAFGRAVTPGVVYSPTNQCQQTYYSTEQVAEELTQSKHGVGTTVLTPPVQPRTGWTGRRRI